MASQYKTAWRDERRPRVIFPCFHVSFLGLPTCLYLGDPRVVSFFLVHMSYAYWSTCLFWSAECVSFKLFHMLFFGYSTCRFQCSTRHFLVVPRVILLVSLSSQNHSITECQMILLEIPESVKQFITPPNIYLVKQVEMPPPREVRLFFLTSLPWTATYPNMLENILNYGNF